MAPVEDGETGALYYNYAPGSVYRYRPRKGEAEEYRIVGCELKGGREYYTVERNGKRDPKPVTANRIHYLLHQKELEVVREGVREEYPLLKEEVKAYYTAQTALRCREKSAAIEKLGKTSYYETAKRLRSLYGPMAIAERRGEAQRLAELKERERELKETLGRIMADNGITQDQLRPHVACKKCNDSGDDGVGICECARARKSAIKAYSARLRLAKRREEQKCTGAPIARRI